MRIPWLPLDDQYITVAAPLISGLLRVDIDKAIGLGVRLLAFTVDQTSTQEKPPDGIFPGADATETLEAAVQWCGEAGRLVTAFIRAGVMERLPDGGIRVRGTDRFARTWAKNKRRRGSTGEMKGVSESDDTPDTGADRAGTGALPAPTVPVPCRETETETEKKEEEAQAAAPPASETTLATKQPPPRRQKREQSNQEWLLPRLQENREAVLRPVFGDRLDPDVVERPNVTLKPLKDQDPEVVRVGHSLYLNDDYARSQTPPCPVHHFANDFFRKWKPRALEAIAALGNAHG